MACVHPHCRGAVSMVHQLIIATAFVMLMPYMVSASDDLPKESVLPLALAGKAIQASLDACKKDGYKVSASVMDRGGVLRAMARADGAGPHTVDSSRKKAYTAASLRFVTSTIRY
jgi:hypothetical protein